MANSAAPSVLSSMAPEERRKQMLRAVVASTVGTSIEWYDYFLFGTMAGLVFPHLFFPKSDPLADLNRIARAGEISTGDTVLLAVSVYVDVLNLFLALLSLLTAMRGDER